MKPPTDRKGYTVKVTGNPKGVRIALARVWASAVWAKRKVREGNNR